MQTAGANSGESRFIDSLQSQATVHACMLTCRSSSRMVSILLSHDMTAREPVWIVRVWYFCCIAVVDMVALSERAAPQRSRPPAVTNRTTPSYPSYFVAMVLLSSGVSGMTNMLKTSMMTDNLSPSSGQTSSCWHYDEISELKPRLYGSPARLALLH